MVTVHCPPEFCCLRWRRFGGCWNENNIRTNSFESFENLSASYRFTLGIEKICLNLSFGWQAFPSSEMNYLLLLNLNSHPCSIWRVHFVASAKAQHFKLTFILNYVCVVCGFLHLSAYVHGDRKYQVSRNRSYGCNNHNVGSWIWLGFQVGEVRAFNHRSVSPAQAL